MPPFAWGLLVGGLIGLVLTAFVAAFAHARNERLQERARRAERLAELGTLTGGLTHEIKNPLSTIQLNLQLLREDLEPDSPAYSRLVSRLDTVRKEVSRLRDIVDDFLRFAGRIELDKKPTDVQRMLEDLVDFFTPQAQLQRVQLRVRPPAHGDGEPIRQAQGDGTDAEPGPLLVPLDERMIEQSVLNLMINALQAMPEQGGEIILSARQSGPNVLIEVTDTGRGIGPEVLDKIFDAYYSTKKGGTGLGLAIAKRIAEEHGGRVYATSETGKGSVFTIELPLK
jgi:signal transduction histidine kinase